VNLDWDVLQPAIAAAVVGDRDARERIVINCLPKVRAMVHTSLAQDFRQRHRWMMPLFSTQDVVHEVLVAVVQDLADTQFDGPELFCAYLGSLVRHRLLDAVRFHEAARRDGRKQVGEPADGVANVAANQRETTPTLAASLVERAGLVRDALGELPERQRRLLELRLIDDATFGQISAALGYASDETARQAFHDAQAKLLVKLRVRGFGRTVSR